MNPADLFTKHLPSSIKIAQLVELFGCECRQGRSAAAPLLRPLDSAKGQGGQPSGGHLSAVEVACDDVEAHDIEILTHMRSQYEVDRLFPLLEAPRPGPTSRTGSRALKSRHKKMYGRRRPSAGRLVTIGNWQVSV